MSYPQLTAAEFAAMTAIDWQVIAIGTTAPPGSPADGDAYVVGASPTGAWAGEDHKVAIWSAAGAAWAFVPASVAITSIHKRLAVTVAGSDAIWRWNGVKWLEIATAPAVALTVTSDSLAVATATLALDLALGNSFAVTLNADVTAVTFSHWPASPGDQRIAVYVVQGASARTIAGWPAAVKWPGGTPPTLTAAAGAIDCLVFESFDAGATIFGNIAGQNYS